jgi:hypothetical protein
VGLDDEVRLMRAIRTSRATLTNHSQLSQRDVEPDTQQIVEADGAVPILPAGSVPRNLALLSSID